MARMLELIREGKAPASIVRRAARGELALPVGEAIEILAVLSADSELGAEAERTLEGWDEASLSEVACDAATSPDVLRCLLRTQSARPAVIAAVEGNPSLAGDAVITSVEAAFSGPTDSEEMDFGGMASEDTTSQPVSGSPMIGWIDDGEADDIEREFLAQHAEELAQQQEQAFALVPSPEGEEDPLAYLLGRVEQGESVEKPEDVEQLSLLQRIGRMRVGERIKLAMRGNREERMVLIRDRSKLVSLAVLASPKVNETEMEAFAAMKNVQESVLRGIAKNRKNMKNYGVIRSLANNPKSPLDVSLPLIQYLLIKDLRSLAYNKNVNDTVRKRATRLFRLKTEKKKD